MTGGAKGGGRAWLELGEGLAAGIHHALNNRLAALGGAVQVLQGEPAMGGAMVALLSDEVRKLETTTALLRILGPSDTELEPVQVGDVITQTQRLFDIHHALRDLRLDIQVAEGLPPVWTNPVGLLRILMMMITAVGSGVPRGSPWTPGEGGVVRLKIDGETSLVHIAAEVLVRLEDTELPEIPAEEVASMALGIGATLEISDQGVGTGWTLLVPTLAEARRREREGGASGA